MLALAHSIWKLGGVNKEPGNPTQLYPAGVVAQSGLLMSLSTVAFE